MEVLQLIGVVLLWALVIFVIMAAIVFLWIVWSMDPVAAAKYRELKELVKQANEGDFNACYRCDHDSRINKGIVLCEDRVNIKSHYSVSPAVLYRVFGIH